MLGTRRFTRMMMFAGWAAASVAALPARTEPLAEAPSEQPSSPAEPPGSLVETAGATAEPESDVRDDDPRAIERFRPELEPYGDWVEDPTYGLVWVPRRSVVGERFSPYVTSGHWSFTEDGHWVWVSDFPFGPIVFHYGRWVWTSRGWAWIAGLRYAPAWVVWRVPTGSYDYVGWAPAPPAFYWSAGVAVWFGTPLPYYWVFCPSPYVFAPYPHAYVVTHPGHQRTLAHYTRHYSQPRVRASAPPAPSFRAARIPEHAQPAPRPHYPATRVVGSSPAEKPRSAAPPRADQKPTVRPVPRPAPAPRVVARPAPKPAWDPPRARAVGSPARARPVATPPPRVYTPAHAPPPAPRKR